MALKPCPRCGNYISDKAERCPKCGLDVKDFSSRENPQQPENAPPAGDTRSPQAPQHTTEEYFNGGNDYYYEPPKKSRTGLWIFLSIILTVGIGAAIWIPIHHHNEKLKAEHLALLEQQRLDSIAEVEAEIARLEQIRQDSIEFENTHRLTADIWFTKGKTMMNDNWLEKIQNMDFTAGKFVNTGKVEGDYEYELYDSGYDPYFRTINGRKIEIRDHKYKLLVWGGSGEPATNEEWGNALGWGKEILIIFYDKNDYEDLKNSLKSIGFKKDRNGWILEDKGYKNDGDTLIYFKENKDGKYEIRMLEQYHNG